MKFDVTLSTNGHKMKSEVNFKSLKYQKHNLSIDNLIEYIKNGFVISSNFTIDYQTIIMQRDRKKDNFVNTNIVMIDIDDSDISMPDFIDKLIINPTISYTTFSNGIKGYRFRLLYVFDEAINSIDDYILLYNSIVSKNNLSLKDNCGRNACQNIIGTSNNALITKGNIYSINDFNLDIDNKCKVNSIRKEEQIHYRNEIALSDNEYIKDYWDLSLSELIDEYNSKYIFFQHTPLPEISDDIPYIILPENYIEIKRRWFDNKVVNDNGDVVSRSSKVKKIKDGQNRKKKLFVNAILRRLMIKNLTFEHLLHNLVNELYYYIDNKTDSISKKKLFEIASNAFNSNLTNYNSLSKKSDKRDYIINDNYCIKYNLNKKKVLAMVKRMINFEKIGSLYDCSLSDKDNIIVMKDNGLDISLRTLQYFKKEYNISRYGNKCKVNRIRKEKIIHYTNEIAFSNNNISFYELIEQKLNNIINLDNYSGIWYEVLNAIGYKANQLFREIKSNSELSDCEKRECIESIKNRVDRVHDYLRSYSTVA